MTDKEVFSDQFPNYKKPVLENTLMINPVILKDRITWEVRLHGSTDIIKTLMSLGSALKYCAHWEEDKEGIRIGVFDLSGFRGYIDR